MIIPRGRVWLPRAIAVLTVATLAPLLLWDACPAVFPEQSHDRLAALPLTLIAVACVIHQAARRAAALDTAKAVLLAAAFLFWAANQLWSHHPVATLFNDVAIALFVLDVFFAIMGWPSSGAASTPQASRTTTATGLVQSVQLLKKFMRDR